MKFHDNPSSGSRVFPCGLTDRHDEAIVAFHNFANVPKMVPYEPGSSLLENNVYYRSLGQHGLRRGSAIARLLWLRVRIPPGVWMSVSSEFCVFSGRRLCVGLITCLEELYRVWCVWVWSWSLDHEEVLAHWGLLRHEKKWSLGYRSLLIQRQSLTQVV
jgi:hypothetical protein